MPNKHNKTKKNISSKKRRGGTKTSPPKRKSYKAKSKNPINEYKLSSPEIDDSEYLDRLMEMFDYEELPHEKKKKIPKSVHFGENKIKEITPEGLAQRPSPLHPYKPCFSDSNSERDFPCRYKNTVFNSLEDYRNYVKLKEDRNISTKYKDRKDHYRDILKI
jgi:hypothetical protein